MKKKILKFRNQFLILGLGSMLIFSCTKEDLENVFGGKKDDNKTDTTYNENNGSDECLTCDADKDSVIICYGGKDTMYVDPFDHSDDENNDSGKDSSDKDGYKCFDSIYNNPNYDSEKDGLLLSH
ncbi:MAG: hypothetical protein ACO3E1_05560 [Flavobacteriales bacterium]